MQTQLADFIRNTPDGKEADAILRKCVHCGFCTATCPTYQLLGDELDGPRGRIYLMKQMFEGAPVTRSTQLHLDRCLTCRSCETTCPSGVQYGRLVEIGRPHVDATVPRPLRQRLYWLEALDRDPRRIVSGAPVQLHGQEPAGAALRRSPKRFDGLVLEGGRLELAGRVAENSGEEAPALC